MASYRLVWYAYLVVIFALFLKVSGVSYNPFEPSPYEYGIIQQAALRNNSHNLVLGWRQYGDKLLYRSVVKESYSFMGTTVAMFRYPAWGKSNETITCVLVLDQYSGDTGGYANVTTGGVGLKEVTIRLKSQFNRGFKFLVEIYGK